MTPRFSFFPSTLDGLIIVERRPIRDERGSFARLFCADEFFEINNKPIIQINHSINKETGTTRGLHYQKSPYSESKLVTCIKGEIFDVAVDIRKGSKTFLHWHGELLSADNSKSLFIPEGFAHGFQTLNNDCELIYLHTGSYRSDSEAGLNVLDPRLNIKWPLPISCISERDRQHADIKTDFLGV